jgi:hypothetical protein
MLVLAGCGASSAIAGADPPAPPAPPPPPAPATTMDHDGTYKVGTDIVAGTYSSAGPVGDGACYWKRLGGANGNDIVDNALSKKAQIVQIAPTDASFKTDGCQAWQITDAAPPQALPPAIAGAQLPLLIGQLPKP